MSGLTYGQELWLTVIDKGLLAVIVLWIGGQFNRTLEGLKSRLSRDQEWATTVNTAVVDLTRKLAAGSHLISWLSWSATQPDDSLTKDDFRQYDKDMRALLSDLVGLQASLAALDGKRFTVLSPYAENLYQLDIEVGQARDFFLKGSDWSRAQSRNVLRHIYARTEIFDRHLLADATQLLQLAPPDQVRARD